MNVIWTHYAMTKRIYDVILDLVMTDILAICSHNVRSPVKYNRQFCDCTFPEWKMQIKKKKMCKTNASHDCCDAQAGGKCNTTP